METIASCIIKDNCANNQASRKSSDSGLPTETDLSVSSLLSDSECIGYSEDNSTTTTMDDDTTTTTASNKQQQSISLYHENEYNYVTKKRSSSLKTRRTPPGTPSDKGVRFADAFGLDLATVRHIFNQDCPPLVPESARRDLCLPPDSDDESLAASEDDSLSQDLCHDSSISSNSSSTLTLGSSTYIKKVFQPCFPQPGSNANFSRRVWEQNVCLENANVDEFACLHGAVRVRNLAYHKFVTVRITLNNWINYADVPATYDQSMENSSIDRFVFTYSIPELTMDEKLQFAILFKTDKIGEEFWDNNFGKNYIFMIMEIIKNGNY